VLVRVARRESSWGKNDEKYYSRMIFPWLFDGDLKFDLGHDLKRIRPCIKRREPKTISKPTESDLKFDLDPFATWYALKFIQCHIEVILRSNVDAKSRRVAAFLVIKDYKVFTTKTL